MNALDYNTKRSKSDFAAWASNWRQERSGLDRVHELNRRDRPGKRMFEEAFIVFHYVKEFYRDCEIFVELRDGSQNFDAIIYDEKEVEIEHLEATYVPEPDDHSIRRDLANKGQFSLETMLTHRPSLSDYPKAVSKQIHKKLAKDYPANTTLLVGLSAEMVIEDQERFNCVIGGLDPAITAGKFRRIVIFDELGTYYHVIGNGIDR